ncbi:MAG: SMC-Scp complex subunit ScpB [Elusimicrobia bacterium]|nr:SMC-Scp complex subunit ScpB [Elusimicrobiota bacterium]
MPDTELKNALEALLFITDRPLSAKELCALTQVKDQPRVEALVGEIRRELDDRSSAVQVMEVAQGFQMATRARYAPFIRRLFTDRMTLKLSTASLETLAIVAYKQPITRAEIEDVRGVEVIAALETLMERGLVHVAGRKETVGRPLEYGTTPDFMRRFGLKGLCDLPSLETFGPKPAQAAAETAPAAPGDPGHLPEAGHPSGDSEPRPPIWPTVKDEDSPSS